MNSCNGVGDVSQSVSSPSDNRVVCLSYQANGTAYWSKPGQCVYGLNSSGEAWDVEDCQTGNFKVVARYAQTTDKSRCPAWPQSDEDYTYDNSDSGLQVLLCLSMNYPDALGHATPRRTNASSRTATPSPTPTPAPTPTSWSPAAPAPTTTRASAATTAHSGGGRRNSQPWDTPCAGAGSERRQ